MGLRTLHEGYLTLRILRNPLLGDALSLPPELREAFVEGVAANPAAMPVAIGQLLLGGMLLVTSVATLFGGARTVNFVLQAVVANAVLATVGHALGEPLQQAIATAMLSNAELTRDLPPDVRPEQVQQGFRWGFRALLGVQCLMLGAIAWVLWRPSTREFLALAAAARKEN
jgi:hypothetical protein